MASSPANGLDVLVIGAGPAGVIASLRAARLGARTALITRDEFGGMAANDGPVPVRTLAQAARLIREAKQLPRYGIAAVEPSLDYVALLARVDEVTEDVRMHSLLRADLDNAGVAIHEWAGTARFVDPHTVESDSAPRLQADKVIICTGGISRPLAVPGFGLTATHSHAWHLSSVPASLLVIGAGATGVQVASIFNAFGSDVCIVEVAPRILMSEDEDVSTRSKMPSQRQAFGSSRTPGRSNASRVLQAGCGSFAQRTAPPIVLTPRSLWSRLDGWQPRPGSSSTRPACGPIGAATSRWIASCGPPSRTSSPPVM
jgi:pyruvate/2-oxoglutarate dehydrogenase complex dihydrolipoamide dehydrogenase (E3) component